MATIARTIYNVDSELRDLTRSQGFSILVIPGQQPKENVVIGAKNALFVDENASHTPAFISPDSNILNALKEYRKELEESLLQSGDILGATAVSNSSASGVAMSYRFLGTIESLKISSNIATYYENKIVEMFGKLVDQDFEYVVVYDDNYAPSFLEVKEKAGVLEQVYELNINDEINSAIEQDIITLVGGFMEYDEEKLNRLRNSIMDEDSQV